MVDPDAKAQELILLRRVAKAVYDMEIAFIVTKDVHDSLKKLHKFLHKHPEVL